MIRKQLFRVFSLPPLLSFLCISVSAQGLYVKPGANMVMSGTSNLVLTNCDLHLDGGFTPANSNVIFTGSNQNTSIYGSGITFNDLTVNEATSDVILQAGIAVSSNLNMQSHQIELNNFDLDLGSTGVIVGESNNSYITGQLGGYVLRTETLNAPSAANPGNIGLAITTSGNLGSTLIRRGHVQQTGTTSGVGIWRYFDVLPASGNAALNATLDFYYLDHEITGFTESDLAMSARDVPMGYWNMIGVDNLNTGANILTKNGIDTMGRFTLTSSTNDPLPITLLSFYGSLKDAQAVLNWEVANELSIMRYEVERSADGLSFVPLATVKAHGAGASREVYTYVDPAPFRGSTFYRIKMYDLLEKAIYSRSIRVDWNEAYTLSVYPNPVTDKINVDFNCTELKKLTFQLLDAQGKLVTERQVQPQPGANHLEWNISALPAATYYLRLDGLSDTPVKISKF